MKHHRSLHLGVALASLMAAGSAMAATSVSWTSPPNGSTYPVGTIVNPTGIASGVGAVGGNGLDLALVLDASGSMAGAREAAQEAAAKALVDAVPGATTSVAVVRFTGSGSLALGLTPVSTGAATIKTTIDNTVSSGGTNIGAGISVAATELNGPNHTAGRAKMMVVISDGSSSGNPPEDADAAIAAGVNNIHSVGIPGHNVGTMQGIVNGPDDIYNNADDHGIYTSGSLDQLIALFNGTGGNLVGLDRIDVTLPNGNVLGSYPTDGLGNFTLPNWPIQAGANTFLVTAYGTDQTSASATLTLYGTRPPSGVPDGGSALLLLSLACAGLGAVKHTVKKS